MNLSANTKSMYENLLLTSFISKNSTLLFTIEQWDLTRRLKNSGLTKEQLCQAYDDLDRMESELGGLYNTPLNNSQQQNNQNNINNSSAGLINHHHNANINNKAANGVMNKNGTQLQTFPVKQNGSNKNNVGPVLPDTAQVCLPSSAASTVVNNFFASVIDPDVENKQVDEYKTKGEMAIQSEISFFVYKHDLKQSQIARMAGVNQAYVSKFLRGEFFDLSENGKTLIYKWYLRFLKNPKIYLQAHNISLSASINATPDKQKPATQHAAHVASTDNQFSSSFANVLSATYDAPKRTRFSFKPEHLVILEKVFTESPYPDQKRREELAKLCNEARPGNERERVTEQVVTHWFQNKRKFSRKVDEAFSQKSPNELTGFGNGSSGASNPHNASGSMNSLGFQQGTSSASFDYMNGNNHSVLNQYKSIINGNSENATNDDDEEDDDADEEDEEDDEGNNMF